MVGGRHNDDRVINLQTLFDKADHRFHEKCVVAVKLYGIALDTHVPLIAAPFGSMVTGLQKLRGECDLIGRVTELAGQHPSLPRHPINSSEHLPPSEIGKVRDDIV